MLRRLLRFALRLGALVALAALVIKLLDDRNATAPVITGEPNTPPVDTSRQQPTESVAWVEPQGTVCPPSHPVKAKLGSKVFRTPESPGYDKSKPERCYASEAAARRDGFREAKR